jgi:Cu/Ag efflux protein CusF
MTNTRGTFVLAIACVLLMASLAVAAEIEGTIKSVDPSGRMITLEDGTQLTVPATAKVEAGALKPGAHVKASFDAKGSSKVVTEIQVSPKK